MGVDGLLKWYEPYIKDCHISELSGKRVAIDGRHWFRKASYGQGRHLIIDKNIRSVVDRLVTWITELHRLDISVLIVLEGMPVPLKSDILHKKRDRRDSAYAEAMVALAENDRKTANAKFSEAVEYGPDLCMAIVEQLKIQCRYVEGRKILL